MEEAAGMLVSRQEKIGEEKLYEVTEAFRTA